MPRLRISSLGLALGLVLALGLTRFPAGQLYGVRANDPLTVVSVVALLGLIANAGVLLAGSEGDARGPGSGHSRAVG